ncbi:hypothetical protein J6590_007291 [Homalodisca vitripennis]|nr:hypothetical protein J6590_007291 [Homalodisca vitripennis]
MVKNPKRPNIQSERELLAKSVYKKARKQYKTLINPSSAAGPHRRSRAICQALPQCGLATCSRRSICSRVFSDVLESPPVSSVRAYPVRGLPPYGPTFNFTSFKCFVYFYGCVF